MDYTLSKISTGDYKQKSSSFHAVAEPSALLNHIKFRLLELKEEFSDSSHICYAYRIKQSGRLDEFFSDSGEPNGSAGIHILNILKRKQLINSVIYVIRYFGGTKLGISGLIHAYTTAAENAVSHAIIKPWIQLCSFSLIYQYGVHKQVKSILKQYHAKVIRRNFSESIEISIEIKELMCEEFTLQLQQITNGTINIKK